jgi:hypothetical protein
MAIQMENQQSSNPVLNTEYVNRGIAKVDEDKKKLEQDKIKAKADLIAGGMTAGQAEMAMKSGTVQSLQPQKEVKFIDDKPVQSQVDLPMNNQAIDMMPQIDTSGQNQAIDSEINAIDAGQAEMDQTYKDSMNDLSKLNQETDKELELQKQMELEDSEVKKLQEEQSKIKPQARDFFATKTGFEKVMAGVGLFLSAFTPQGTQNALKIIDGAIEKDLKNQEALYNTKGREIDEAKGNYKLYMDRYKDAGVARSLAKKDILDKLKMDLDMRMQKTNSQVMKAKLAQAQDQIAIEGKKLQMSAYEEIKKQKQDEQNGVIPGYNYIGGAKPDPSIVKDLREREAAKNSALLVVKDLERKLKEGAMMPLSSNKGTAKLQMKELGTSMARAMFGGRFSDTDLETAMSMVPDITSPLTPGSVDREKLNTIKRNLENSVNSYAKSYQYEKKSVGTPIGK